jgi:hypothetical protein
VRWSPRLAALLGATAVVLALASPAVAGTSARHASALTRAAAQSTERHGTSADVVPVPPVVGGYLLSRWWLEVLSRPFDEANPLVASGCVRYGPIALQYPGPGVCTVPRGTWIFLVAFTTECSSIEDPPFHASNFREAAACGLASDRMISTAAYTLDGGRPVEVASSRFGAFIPWTKVVMPENGIFGGTPGDVMFFGGHGFVGLLPPPAVGRHNLHLHVDGSIPDIGLPADFDSPIVVTPR